MKDVVPALTKAGCNAGTCHGSFQGRGGLQLSLLGFNAAADYDALAKQARGRRVSITAAEHSLLLRKPSGQLPHGGGVRLQPSDEAYQVLLDWIRQGAQGPTASPAEVERVVLSADDLVLQPGRSASVRVQAEWSDGASRDVTHWALFDAAPGEIARVTNSGEITALRHGRTSVTVRFSGQVAAVTVTVPRESEADLAAFRPQNFIDELTAAEWKKLGVSPAPLCDDATFVRRVHLDLTGTLPTPEELRQRLAHAREQGWREQLVDDLLDRPEYVDYWTLFWSDLLRAHRRPLGEKGLGSFRSWMRETIRTNRPVDEWVEEILTARGNLYTNGPVAFYFVDSNPQDLAETTAQVFLGVRMRCARCHHHPFEVWSQEEYYGLAAFFSGVQRKDTREQGLFGGSQSIRAGASQPLPHPWTGAPVGPRLLGQPPLQVDADVDARPLLAAWVTDPANPFFAKNIVNRFWGQLFGRGLVHPVDDLRATNPAAHPALLDRLAADFVEHRYDVKHLLRTICGSTVYQLAAEIEPTRDENGVLLTHRVPRRLPAEVLLDAINRAVGAREVFAGLPADTTAISLPDPEVRSTFLDIFGRPRRTSVCTCERVGQLDLRQALHLVNSEQLSQKIAAPEGRLAKLIAAGASDQEIIEVLYLATLSRLPDDFERSHVTNLLAETSQRQEVLEDLLWTLINCAEFSFAR